MSKQSIIIDTQPPFGAGDPITTETLNAKLLAVIEQGNDSQRALSALVGEHDTIKSEDGAANVGAKAVQDGGAENVQGVLEELHKALQAIPEVADELEDNATAVPTSKAVLQAISDLTVTMETIKNKIAEYRKVSDRKAKKNFTDLDGAKLGVSQVTRKITSDDDSVPSNHAVANALGEQSAFIQTLSADLSEIQTLSGEQQEILEELPELYITQAELSDILLNYYNKLATNNMLNSKADISAVLTKDNTENYTPTEPYNPATKLYVDQATNSIENGLPSGGYTGDYLGKVSPVDYDAKWIPSSRIGDTTVYKTVVVLTPELWESNGAVYLQSVRVDGLRAAGHVHSYSPTDDSRTFFAAHQIWGHAVIVDDSMVFEARTAPSEPVVVQIFQSTRGLWGAISGPMQAAPIVLPQAAWLPKYADDGVEILAYTQTLMIPDLYSRGFVHSYTPDDASKPASENYDVWMRTVTDNDTAVFEASEIPEVDITGYVIQTAQGELKS